MKCLGICNDFRFKKHCACFLCLETKIKTKMKEICSFFFFFFLVLERSDSLIDSETSLACAWSPEPAQNKSRKATDTSPK